MLMTHIGHGFHRIGDRDARKLAGGTLPGPGRERKVTHDGRDWWLARTIVHEMIGERFTRLQVWSIRHAD